MYETQKHIISHLRKGTPLYNDAKSFLRNIEIEEAVYSSDMRGVTMPLPLGVPTATAKLCVADVRAELGEGPIWDERRSVLLWVDILHAKIFSTDVSTGATVTHDLSAHTRHVTTVVPCDSPVGGGGGVGDSMVVVGTTEGVAMVNLQTGEVTQHPSNGTLHGEFVRMNDGKADPQGRFWVGSVAKKGWAPLAPTIRGGAKLYVLEGWGGTPKEVTGLVAKSSPFTHTHAHLFCITYIPKYFFAVNGLCFVVRSTMTLFNEKEITLTLLSRHQVVRDVTIANGLAWTPDGSTMYVRSLIFFNFYCSFFFA